jgi:hypothetical protein
MNKLSVLHLSRNVDEVIRILQRELLLHIQLFDKKRFRLLILDSIEGHSVKKWFCKIYYYSPTKELINYDKNAAAFCKASG